MKRSSKSPLPSSFAWLNVTQFLGALNDNVFKLLVVFFLLGVLGEAHRASVVTLASAIFVLPFLLFSQASGVLADRISKQRVIVFAKALEVLVMVLGCVALALGSRWGLYGVIFLMSTQSALFGPAKYGIIPELVSTDKLSRANSFLVGLTYLAIIIGTFVPSYLLLTLLDGNFLWLSVFCVAVAVCGLAASSRIERTTASGSKKRFSPWFPLEIARTLRSISSDRELLLAVFASAYFLLLGGFIQQNALLYGQEHLGLTFIQSGYLFPVAALGIGIGAWLCGKLSGRNIEFGLVPIGALGLTLGCVGMGLVPPTIKSVVMVIFVIGVSAGLFIVPLNAFVQFRSPRETRGQILASNSFLGFLGVAVSAGLLFVLSRVLGLTARTSFLVIGALTGLLAIVAIRVLPDFLVRFVVIVVTRILYRIRVRGIERLPVEGPALLVPNHVTWVDALLLSATTQRRIRFVMAKRVAEEHWLRSIFRLMQAIPISPKDPPREIVAALRAARKALDEGYLVCIFAEGALTRNGNMQAFRAGFERIVKGTDYPVIPVYIGGGWGSIFSHCYGKLLSTYPRRIPYPITVSFGNPLPTVSSAHEVRLAVEELSCEYFETLKSPRRILPRQFLRSVRRRWFRPAISDTTGKRLRFGEAAAGAIALGDIIEGATKGQQHVGVLLPASAGGALTNIAITLLGKVAVNLNFTASREAMRSAIEQAELKTVITSRRFIEKLEGVEAPEGSLFLEDVAGKITPARKIWGLVRAAFAPASVLMRGRHVAPDDLATIIFSSGSTGDPKGVMLSHHNIISNIEGFRDVYRFTREDGMCAGLPFFHSFGFTCTLWCPVVTGFRVSFHPNPLDGVAMAELVREEKLTILLATPTFLSVYLRRAKPEDFATLRSVIVGAEKLKQKLADAFERRFGVRPLEGYGATELSPAVALSLPDVTVETVTQIGFKEGSVGHAIPGLAVKVVDPDSGAPVGEGEQGLLLVKGPGVMLGYLGKPELTAETVKDGWYNTGDIGRVDEDGFVFLVDRLSRYSKIAGEMVPHLAIEDAITEQLGAMGRVIAVTAVEDERKGEQLVLFYTDEAGTEQEVLEAMHACELPNLWRPRKQNCSRIEQIPALGSGKTDLKRLRQLAQDFVEHRPSTLNRAIDSIRRSL